MPSELRILTGEYQLISGADAVGLALGGTPVTATDRQSAQFEAWQFVCGQGPAVDAYGTNRSVEVRDGPAAVDHQWPLLRAAFGVWPFSSVLAIPFGFVGAAGTLCFYTRAAMSRDTDRVVAAQCAAHASAWLAINVDGGRHVDLGTYDQVNLAARVVMAQTGLQCEDAVAVIRAHAFSSPDDLETVLQAIVERRLRLALS